MGMDDSWREVYEKNAKKELPDYKMSCWSKEDFDNLLFTTKELVKSLDKSANKKKIKTILDLGCGPGFYCSMLQEMGYEVTGADYSETTIDIARKRYPGIKFLVEDGYDMNLDDKSFDLVISIGALQCVYEYEKFLSEMTRIAGKAIIISTIHRRHKVEDPQKLVEKQLKSDSWPTRDFHPDEIIDFLEKKGFNARAIRKMGKRSLGDHFFVIAERK
jgi:ubiquinone/menaquinone biosynthesis C-methylase UbiE